MRDAARAFTIIVLVLPFVLLVPGEAQATTPTYLSLTAYRLDGSVVQDVTAGETINFVLRVKAGSSLLRVYHDLEMRDNGNPYGPTRYWITQGGHTDVSPYQTRDITIRWDQGLVLPSGTPIPGRYAVVYDDVTNSDIDAHTLIDVDWQPNFWITKIVTSSPKLHSVAGKHVHNAAIIDVEGCVHNNGREAVTSIEVGLGFRTPIDPTTSPVRLVQTQGVNLASAPSCVSKFVIPPTLQGSYFKFSWFTPEDAAELSALASQIVLVADPQGNVAESSEIDNEKSASPPPVLS